MLSEQIHKKINMLIRWQRILFQKSATAIPQGMGRCYSKGVIKGYYNDLTGKVTDKTLLDSDALPITQIGNNEYVHFPIAVFQYGLGCYDLYLLAKEQKELLLPVIKIAEWALNTQRSDGSWDCFSPIKSKKYTVSSMGQGEGASLLFRAYTATQRPEFLQAGFKAIDFMLKDVNDGGTSVYIDDKLYLEEYPQTPRRSVLNGWIFSLFGLYDASLLDDKYKSMFKNSVETLKETLDSFDNGFWSTYDLGGMIASPAYHELHIALLNVLAEISDMPEIAEKATTFLAQKNNKWYRAKAIIVKITQKLTESSDAIVIQ